jgi:hypothetical protein
VRAACANPPGERGERGQDARWYIGAVSKINNAIHNRVWCREALGKREGFQQLNGRPVPTQDINQNGVGVICPLQFNRHDEFPQCGLLFNRPSMQSVRRIGFNQPCAESQNMLNACGYQFTPGLTKL